MEPQVIEEPKKSSSLTTIIFATFLIVSLGFSGFLFYQISILQNQIKTLKPQANFQKNLSQQKELALPTKIPSKAMDNSSNTIYKYPFSDNSEMGGGAPYNIQFTHPINWVVSIANIRKGAGIGGSDCADIIITEPESTSKLIIKPTCGTYIGKLVKIDPYTLTEIGRIGQGGGGAGYARTVRYYDPATTLMHYRDIGTLRLTESLRGKSANDTVAVFPDSTFGYSDFVRFVLIELDLADGGDPLTKVVIEADQIVKSLIVTK